MMRVFCQIKPRAAGLVIGSESAAELGTRNRDYHMTSNATTELCRLGFARITRWHILTQTRPLLYIRERKGVCV